MCSFHNALGLTEAQVPKVVRVQELCRLGLRRFKNSLRVWFGNRQVFNLVSKMTLLLLILHTDRFLYLRIPVTILSIAGLLYSPLVRKARFWFAITLVLGFAHWLNWYMIFNHKYLMTYWCLALGCSQLAPNPRRALAANARLLIGLCFFFATLWKSISPDFLDGSFLHFSLLDDPRFKSVSVLLGGMRAETFQRNKEAISSLSRYDSTLNVVQLQDTPRVIWLARFLTWWTIGVEGLIAIAFLCPEGRLISKWRDVVLILFLLSTYPIADVIGYGWLLAIMGLAQSTFTFKYSRPSYLLAFLVLPIYEFPLGQFVQLVLGHSTFSSWGSTP